MTTGVTAAFGILAALRHRDATGEGVEVGTSLFEQAVFAQSPLLAWSDQRGVNPPRLGNQSPMALIIDLASADGMLVLAIPTEKMWQRLCTALALPELAADPTLATAGARLTQQERIASLLNDSVSSWSVEEVSTALVAGGVPFAPVNDYRATLETAPAISGSPLIELEHERYGRLRVAANPLRSSAWDVTVRRQSPVLGQHTDEIMRNLEHWGNSTWAERQEGDES